MVIIKIDQQQEKSIFDDQKVEWREEDIKEEKSSQFHDSEHVEFENS